MIVLDTHVWLWWISNPENLSSRADKAIEQAIDENRIHVSSISVWEVAMLVQKNRLLLSMNAHDWVRKAEALPVVQFLPMDNTIAQRAVSLPGKFHQDPADRIIVATALSIGAMLITKNKKIRTYRHVKTIW